MSFHTVLKQLQKLQNPCTSVVSLAWLHRGHAAGRQGLCQQLHTRMVPVTDLLGSAGAWASSIGSGAARMAASTGTGPSKSGSVVGGRVSCICTMSIAPCTRPADVSNTYLAHGRPLLVVTSIRLYLIDTPLIFLTAPQLPV